MHREPLALIGISDISGRVRGKAVPTVHLAEHIERGIGWTPTNVMITAFGPILDTPFAGLGDILMRPVPETEVKVDFGGDAGSEHFLLADIVNTDGTPWACCLRNFLARAVAALTGGRRRARLLRLRAGVRLYRRHRRIPQRLHASTPSGARGRSPARWCTPSAAAGIRTEIDSRGVRAGPVRDHLRARPRHRGGRARHRHPRAGARHRRAVRPARHLHADAAAGGRGQRRAHPYELPRRARDAPRPTIPPAPSASRGWRRSSSPASSITCRPSAR